MKNAIIEFDRPLGRHRKVGDIDAAVAAARRALEMGPWGRMTAVERGSRLLLKLSGTISDRVNEIAAIEARDTGEPMSVARADAVAVARYFEFYGALLIRCMARRARFQHAVIFTGSRMCFSAFLLLRRCRLW